MFAGVLSSSSVFTLLFYVSHDAILLMLPRHLLHLYLMQQSFSPFIPPIPSPAYLNNRCRVSCFMPRPPSMSSNSTSWGFQTRHAKFPSELRATTSHCIMGFLNANSGVRFLHNVYTGFLILMTPNVAAREWINNQNLNGHESRRQGKCRRTVKCIAMTSIWAHIMFQGGVFFSVKICGICGSKLGEHIWTLCFCPSSVLVGALGYKLTFSWLLLSRQPCLLFLPRPSQSDKHKNLASVYWEWKVSLSKVWNCSQSSQLLTGPDPWRPYNPPLGFQSTPSQRGKDEVEAEREREREVWVPCQSVMVTPSLGPLAVLLPPSW